MYNEKKPPKNNKTKQNKNSHEKTNTNTIITIWVKYTPKAEHITSQIICHLSAVLATHHIGIIANTGKYNVSTTKQISSWHIICYVISCGIYRPNIKLAIVRLFGYGWPNCKALEWLMAKWPVRAGISLASHCHNLEVISLNPRSGRT